MSRYLSVGASRIQPVEPYASPYQMKRNCWRCGIKFIDGRSQLAPGAPCRDCRDALKDTGVDVGIYFRTGIDPRKKAAS
jgi:hypothetical protein